MELANTILPVMHLIGKSSKSWAKTVPHCIGNPLYHWTHMELKIVFGINKLLSPQTAKEIYDECNEKLSQPTLHREHSFNKRMLNSLVQRMILFPIYNIINTLRDDDCLKQTLPQHSDQMGHYLSNALRLKSG